MPSTVVIIGGRGNIGQEVALGLLREEQIGRIVLADLRANPSGLRDRLRKNGKVSLVEADATDPQSLAGLLRGAKVVVNCAGPFVRTLVPVARAAVAAGGHCIDVCDDSVAVGGLLETDLDHAAREAGVTLLTGMGSDPGTNNILAKWYADKLDRVDEVALYWAVGIGELDGAALEHTLHMAVGKVPQYLDGALKYVEGGTGEETVVFPEPIGACVVRHVGHPQPLTMPPHLKGVRRLVVKGAILPAWVDPLILAQRDMGLLSKVPVEVRGVKVAPYDMALRLWQDIPAQRERGPELSGLKVVVKGERAGRQVVYAADMVGGMGPGTGLPAAIAVRMLCGGDITARGLLPPEACVDPGRFLLLLTRCGARIEQTETMTSLLDASPGHVRPDHASPRNRHSPGEQP